MSKELLKQVEELKNKIDEANIELEKLHKQIEDKEKESKAWWTPKIGAEYYFIGSRSGKIGNYDYYKDDFDEECKNNLNMYKMKEEAERVLFEELLHRKLVKFAFENNDEVIDWNDYKQDKFSIAYSCSSKDLFFNINTSNKMFGQVYFTSSEIVDKAIKEFNKDLIRYFTTNK